MGGVPVLLALAVVGVDYGYQPDGQGDIDYIVQVAPEHWEQARDAGEITSVIDPAVRGRVNRIIIRIGDEELPRDAGPDASAPLDEAPSPISPAHALSPMPPVSETATNIRTATADDAFVPAPNLVADAGPAKETLGAQVLGAQVLEARVLGARVMRPDPQSRQDSGGYALPGSGSDDRASSGGGQEEQRWPSEAELAAERAAQQRAAQQRAENERAANGSAADSDRRAEQGADGTNGRPSDDPLYRLSQGSNSSSAGQTGSGSSSAHTSGDRVPPPSTEPRSAASASGAQTDRPGSQPSRPSASRDEGNWTENLSASRGPSTSYPRSNPSPTSGSSATSPDSDRRPMTPSYGFGAQPRSPMPNSNASEPPGKADYADTPASLQGNRRAPTQDNRLAGYDLYGRPVNAAGELIAYPDQTDDRRSVPEPPAGRGYGAPSYADAYRERYAMADSSANRGVSQAEAARIAERSDVPQYGRERESAAGTGSSAEPSSPSDSAATRKAEQEIAAELAATRAALANADAAKKSSVVSQPVFNFLLLVSLVANAYLILQMSRLLQRYRNMVANMRSASNPVS